MPIPQPPTALVGIPVALQALPVSSSKIALTAIYGATAVTNYTFQRATSPTGPWTTAVQQISPAFTDGGLNPSTTYYYQANVLTAETPARTTQWSMVAQATTNPAAIVANKTFNPNTPAGTVGGVTNYQSLATACASLVRGDHLEIQSPVVSSRLSPWIAKNAGNVAERINLLNISGTQAQPIIISVRVGDYVMLDMPLAQGTTSLPDNGLSPDPGQSLLHFESSNWILCDFRDQTQSTLLDFSQELDPTVNWALTIGNRAHWLANIANTTLGTNRYQHWASTNQINSNHLLICGAQINGAAAFAASFMARNCSWIDIRYVDGGCHGNNDQASGDLWPMQGDHFRVIDCSTQHSGHQNWSFEGTNFITRRLRANGGWADIATGLDGDTYAGGNVSSCRLRKWNPMTLPIVGGLWTVPSNFDPGSSLHEQNHYLNTGKSLNLVNTGLPFLKLEGYAPILRFSVFENHRGANIGYTILGSSSEPISSNSPFDTSAIVLHGRASMYHCVGHVINGIFLYEDSEFPLLWAAGKSYKAGQYIRNSSGFVYKAQSTGTSGTTQPTGTGTPSDGNITWTFLANHLLVNANHGFGNLIINNVFDQSSTPQNNVPMLEFNLANSGAGRGSFPSNNKGFRVRNNLVNWTSGTTTFAQEFQFQCTGPSDIMLATTPSFYGGLIGNNRAYSPAFVNVAALSNNLCTVAIKGMILAPSNTDGLGTAEPLATVQNNVTLGTAITVDNVAPFFDGNGWADETPDTISILSASGTVKITVQIKAGSRSLAANTFSTAAPVTTVATDGIYVESPWSGLPLLNNGVG